MRKIIVFIGCIVVFLYIGCFLLEIWEDDILEPDSVSVNGLIAQGKRFHNRDVTMMAWLRVTPTNSYIVEHKREASFPKIGIHLDWDYETREKYKALDFTYVEIRGTYKAPLFSHIQLKPRLIKISHVIRADERSYYNPSKGLNPWEEHVLNKGNE